MAAPVSKSGVLVSDFPGLRSNSGPMADPDSPGYGVVQENLMSVRPGEMRVRPGYSVVGYDEEPETEDSVYPYPWIAIV